MKSKLIMISEEVAQQLRSHEVYEHGDSYRQIIVKLLQYYDDMEKVMREQDLAEKQKQKELKILSEQFIEPTAFIVPLIKETTTENTPTEQVKTQPTEQEHISPDSIPPNGEDEEYETTPEQEEIQ